MKRESCKVYERYENTPSITARKIYYYIRWAGRFVCYPNFYIEREKWPDLLIIHTNSGKGKLFYRGKEYILDNSNYAILNCMDNAVYYPISEDEYWSFSFLHFNGKQAIEMYEHIYDITGGCVFGTTPKIEDNVEKCINLCKNRVAAFEVQISKYISSILHETIFYTQNDDRDKVTEVCKYIEENYDKDITTDAMAKISCFSRCYFSTVFKKHTGTTLHDYITCYRIAKAKELLINGKTPISNIAEKTGFNDTGTFIRAFKKKENVTPLQYRKEHSRKHLRDGIS